MYGVVLWKNTEGTRAVIWCEDHGELAFLAADDRLHDGKRLEAGDLIHFELAWDGDTRRANGPRLVVSKAYPALATDLVEYASDVQMTLDQTTSCAHPNVVSFTIPDAADAAYGDRDRSAASRRKMV